MRNVKEKVKWRTSGQVLMCKNGGVAGYLLLKQIHLKIRLKYWSSKLWVLHSSYPRLACECGGGAGKGLVCIHETRQWDSEKEGKGGSVWKKK